MLHYFLGTMLAASPMMSSVVTTTITTCTLNGKPVDCNATFAGIGSVLGPGMIVFFIIVAVIVILTIVSHWIIYDKAGEHGWASIIPIYNIIVLLRIVREPLWWIILFFIPIINIIIAFVVAYRLAQSFGKDIGFTLGLFFLHPIFYPILAFGDSSYAPLDSQTIPATFV